MVNVFPPFDAALFWNTIFDKGLLGGVLAFLLYRLNRSLERFKTTLAFELERAKVRVQKAQRVWELVGDFTQSVDAIDFLPIHTGEWPRTGADPFENLRRQIADNMRVLAEERRKEEVWLGVDLCRALDQLDRDVSDAMHLLHRDSLTEARSKLRSANERIGEAKKISGWQ